MSKESYLWGTGVGGTITSFITTAMPYLQFLAVTLAIVATGLAIYLHIRKIRDGKN